MIIDAHVHVSTVNGENPRSEVGNLIKKMDLNKIDKAIVFPFSSGIEKQKTLAKAIKPFADRFIPLVFISPHDADAKEQLLYCLDELGMHGMKLHPWFGNFHVDDLELLGPLFEILGERKLHVVLHCTTDDHRMHPLRVETLAKAFPDVTIQMAHMGEVWGGEYAIAAAKRVSNIYLDTAIASFNAVRMAMLEVPDKLCMGCDYPFYMFEMEKLKQQLAADDVGSVEVLRKVMGENIAKALKIS